MRALTVSRLVGGRRCPRRCPPRRSSGGRRCGWCVSGSAGWRATCRGCWWRATRPRSDVCAPYPALTRRPVVHVENTNATAKLSSLWDCGFCVYYCVALHTQEFFLAVCTDPCSNIPVYMALSVLAKEKLYGIWLRGNICYPKNCFPTNVWNLFLFHIHEVFPNHDSFFPHCSVWFGLVWPFFLGLALATAFRAVFDASRASPLHGCRGGIHKTSVFRASVLWQFLQADHPRLTASPHRPGIYNLLCSSCAGAVRGVWSVSSPFCNCSKSVCLRVCAHTAERGAGGGRSGQKYLSKENGVDICLKFGLTV